MFLFAIFLKSADASAECRKIYRYKTASVVYSSLISEKISNLNIKK